MSDPLVSVLITTFDRPAMLRQALASVLAQTVADLEVIVLDDCGPTTAAFDVVADAGDPRVRYLRNERNLGIGPSNVRLFREAHGKYMSHLDDDDLWRPHFLERLVGALELHHEAGLAFANHVIIDEDGVERPEATAQERAYWGREQLTTGLHRNGRALAAVTRSVPMSHSAVIRRATFDLDLYQAEAGDAWDMWAACLAVRRSGLAWFDRNELTQYREHTAQMNVQRSSDKTFAGLVWNLWQMLGDPLFAAEHPQLRRRLVRQEFLWAANLAIRDRKVCAALRHAANGVRAALSQRGQSQRAQSVPRR